MFFKTSKLTKCILIVLIAASFKFFYGVPVEFSEIDLAATSLKTKLPEVNHTSYGTNKLMFNEYLSYVRRKTCFNRTYINDMILAKGDMNYFSTTYPQAKVGRAHELFARAKIPLFYVQTFDSIYLPKEIELFKFENFIFRNTTGSQTDITVPGTTVCIPGTTITVSPELGVRLEDLNEESFDDFERITRKSSRRSNT
jgi:hypothetical protein